MAGNFIACIVEGIFDEVSGSDEAVIMPDVTLADLGGEGFNIAAELDADRKLLCGQVRQFSGVTFSWHFEHNKVRHQVNKSEGCCEAGQSNNCSPAHDFYGKDSFGHRFIMLE